MMHGYEKSSSAIVAVKPVNNTEPPCPVMGVPTATGHYWQGRRGRGIHRKQRFTVGWPIHSPD
jgi:hypothetical protein